jgi:hypothetical protein
MSIVHHEGDQANWFKAREALRQAQRVCFLGFSFHELNLAKLGIPEITRGKEIVGTCYGMTGPATRKAAERLGPIDAGHLLDFPILEFLKRCDFMLG